MNEKIFSALDGDLEARRSLSSSEEARLQMMAEKLKNLKKDSFMPSDTAYFETILPRFRNRIEGSRPAKQSVFSPYGFMRLAAGAVLPVFLVFYLFHLQSSRPEVMTTDEITEIVSINQYQTIEEMIIESPEAVNETVDNSFREIISVETEDLHTVLRESPATEDELEQLLQDSDLDEIIAQLEKKKIL